ncbi:MAG: hypothetical protein JW720_08925 [Sedimentisphaerales bacterium]|nr:hypothetical protein [Sedimentisphaerales bacterium]
MFKDQADFEDIVARLNIDDEPNLAHREKLRREMLSVFDKEAEQRSDGARVIKIGGRSWLRSPFVKLAAAAAIAIVAAIGAYQFNKPDSSAPVGSDVKTEDGIGGSEAVHIGTPQFSPIVLELPRPMFVGTPQLVRVANLEKPLGKPRPPFLAPIGTANVALGKSVQSSDGGPLVGELGMITDDDKEGSDASCVELGPSVRHITIDLEAMHNIYAVVVWHDHRKPRVYFDVIVQAADDGDFTKNVRTLFNNDIDNSAGQGVGGDKHYTETFEGKLINARGAKARYIRLYSNGSTGNELNHYTEVAVYGIRAD